MLFENLFYPDLQERKKAVQHLASEIHDEVVVIFTSMQDTSSDLHDFCEEYQLLPTFDDSKSYNANFDALADVLEQWATTAKKQYGDIDHVGSDIKALVDMLEAVNPHSKEDLKSAKEQLVSYGRIAGNAAIAIFAGRLILKSGLSLSRLLAPLLGKSFARIASLFAQEMVAAEVLPETELTAVEAEAADVVAEGVEGGLLAGFVDLGVVFAEAAAVFVLFDAIFDAVSGAMEREHLQELQRKYEEEYNKLKDNAEKIRKAARDVRVNLIKLEMMV